MLPTPSPRCPPDARLATITASVLLAALVNAAALGAADRMSDLRPTASAAPRTLPLRARVVVFEPRPLPEPAVFAADFPAITPLHSPPVVAPRPTALREPTPTMPRAPGTELPAEGTPQPVRLYGFDEVDKAAEPEEDWALDIATLDAAGLSRFAFELIVDAHGQVIACTVFDPIGLDDAVRADLETRLASTPLRPAERGGRFVASVRRIEMQLEPSH